MLPGGDNLKRRKPPILVKALATSGFSQKRGKHSELRNRAFRKPAPCSPIRGGAV
jgi:hypothetical protein